MTAIDTHELGQPTEFDPTLPEAQEFAGKAPETTEQDAEIIPFPVATGVGEVAVRSFATSSEYGDPLKSRALEDSGVSVRQGSGSARYFSRSEHSMSVAPHSQGYGNRVRQLPNR